MNSSYKKALNAGYILQVFIQYYL